MSHKKSAHDNAAERIATQNPQAEQPSVPISNQAISEGRFPGETPLTGEDRPVTDAGGKREQYDPTAVAAHAATGPIEHQSTGDIERAGGATEISDAKGADYKV